MVKEGLCGGWGSLGDMARRKEVERHSMKACDTLDATITGGCAFKNFHLERHQKEVGLSAISRTLVTSIPS